MMSSYQGSQSRRKGFFPFPPFAGLGIGFLSIFILTSCTTESKVAEKARPSIPVNVATVIQKDVPVQLRVVGNVEAYSVVSIRALVEGQLWKVYFKEGQDVQKDDLLLSIDPRPLEATLRQAEANLERDQAMVNQVEANLTRDLAQVTQAEANLTKDLAQAKNAEEQTKRYVFLVEKGYVAKEQYDQVRTNSESLAATVQADKAAIENAQAALRANKAALENARAVVRASRAAVETARIQLGYCSIRAPIRGRTGSLLVQQGNIIKANDVPIVVINEISPIYVTFALPEQNLPDIKKHMAIGAVKVEAVIPGEEKSPEPGILTFIDNAVDTATGTIKLKGTFDNKEKRLWPGQFVNVVLTLTTRPNAILVPSQAIQTGQEGPYVFVVKPDLTVESRPVAVNHSLDGLTVVIKGLQPGEMVVTNGQFQLVTGGKVEIKKESGERGKLP
ncbi:MAG: efflux transporter, family, subunit [Deltaproteobacteria bacterium]|nr:efflux transporter, family, subunit [Deltaproteobacteria bacterium]